jgi:dynein heavy chain 1, cytosolic
MMETAPSPLGAHEPVANGISSPLASIDPGKLVEHLVAVVTIALGATRDELEQDGNLLSSANHSDTVQRCVRFASDSQVALYVQKEITPASNVEDGPLDNGMCCRIYVVCRLLFDIPKYNGTWLIITPWQLP